MPHGRRARIERAAKRLPLFDEALEGGLVEARHGRRGSDGTLRLARTGSFGYTVRVLPKHPALIGGVELGLVTNA